MTQLTIEELQEHNRRLLVAICRAGDLGRYYQHQLKKERTRAAKENRSAVDKVMDRPYRFV